MVEVHSTFISIINNSTNLYFIIFDRFWKRLGNQISKNCPGESKIHIACQNVHEGRQGKEVRNNMYKASTASLQLFG